jgi:hypothetical protein
MAKTNKSVVRNAGKMATQFEACERHNERENVEYKNADIVKARAELNIQYRRVFHSDSTPETYEETFKRLLAEGTIVKKGLKADAKVFGELVFDINTDYFEQYGGYDYAKKFYEEVYRYAVKEIGSEDYILSAVMHADERNSGLSKELGRDDYHYHLHDIYIPVVQKEVYYQKTNTDPALAGKLKEVIPQISHSKKWPIRVPVERDGKTIILNEYSLLQDRFFEHMKSAGFDGFERGERGSTAEHLSVLEYKSQQEAERLSSFTELADEKKEEVSTLSAEVENKQGQVASLDVTAGKQKKQIEKNKKELEGQKTAKATIAEIEAMGKPALLGGVNFTADEAKKLKSLAKKSVTITDRSAEWSERVDAMKRQIGTMESEIASVKKDRDYWRNKFKNLEQMVKPYLTAIINFPEALKSFIDRHWQERRLEQQHNKSQTKGMDI